MFPYKNIEIMLIALTLLLLISILFLILFMLKSINKKSFKADDGSVFVNKSELDLYQSLYLKTKPLFVLDDQKTNTTILGFEKYFLNKLTKDGFSDLKTLFKYRKQIKSLSDLINS